MLCESFFIMVDPFLPLRGPRTSYFLPTSVVSTRKTLRHRTMIILSRAIMAENEAFARLVRCEARIEKDVLGPLRGYAARDSVSYTCLS